MTDLSGPEPAVDDSSALTPIVNAIDGADPELVAIGERYWALAGFADGCPVWCEKVKDIDTAGWGHQKHAVAAAGVRAFLPGQLCPECAYPLSLTSRTALQQAVDGQTMACVECTESLLIAARLVADPARKAKRDAAKAEAEAHQARQGARERWRQAQREAVDSRYAACFPSDGDALPGASVRQMVAALALLRYAPSPAPIPEIQAWPDPWHPSLDKAASLLGELVRADLVKIHPSTPVTAFVWEPATFDEAVQETENGPDTVDAPQLTGSFYPTLARFFAPYGTSAEKAVEQLDAGLTDALDPAGMTAARQGDLLAVAHELIAEEAVRYFSNRLEDLHLPAVPDNHSARLEEAAYKVAEHRCLGEIYNLVWRATRTAAEAAQKNPRAPRTHMTTHAVNQFESLAQRAIADPQMGIKAFAEVHGQGPAAMTRTLFYAILDSNPVETSLPQIQGALPAPAAAAGTGTGQHSPMTDDDDLQDIINWLTAYPDSWNPADVPAALARFEALPHDNHSPLQFEGRLVARGATHLRRMYDRLAPAIGDREAALAILAATALLVHPLTIPRAPTTGEWLLGSLTTLLLGLPEADAEDSEAP
ncbi:hypothetical protein [Streptomyces telluris]|uniref:Uncharacterized protein n=3 Tax=Streptomyces telluris TaxID=2720021 RepID=A0A9X2RMM3_9ACTN|nr:hypothetical protein [Streptomyces telluris]MCQ8772092.1 hypothetical protein [Streptomyces telluris]